MADCTTCQDCTAVPTGPVCPEGPLYTANSCPDTLLTDCVNYSGPDQPCFSISSTGTPSNLTTVIKNVLSYLSTFFSRFTSSSLTLTPSNSNGCPNQLAIELIPSAQVGNILILGSDGKPYVPQSVVDLQGSRCISFVSSGPAGAIKWTPVLDFNCISQNITPTAIQCAAPTSVSISNIVINGATVSFGITGGLTYNILVNNVVSATNVTSPYNITGLDPNTNYTITVRVNCASGATSDTIISFTTAAILSCNNPTNLQITSI